MLAITFNVWYIIVKPRGKRKESHLTVKIHFLTLEIEKPTPRKKRRPPKAERQTEVFLNPKAIIANLVHVVNR